MIDGEYKKLLKQYHKLSDRHILVAETDMPYSDVLKIVILSDKIRKAGNELDTDLLDFGTEAGLTVYQINTGHLDLALVKYQMAVWLW